MSRWTRFRNKAEKAVTSATVHPVTVVRTVASVIRDPSHLGRKDQYGASNLDIVGNPFSYDTTSRRGGQAVGAAIATYFGGTAVYSALGYGGSSAVEVGIAGTDVGVAAGSAEGGTLIGGGTTAATVGGTSSLFSSSNLGTFGLVLAALKKGNVAGAVDAATGTDWGTAYFGGGSSGGSSGGFARGGDSGGDSGGVGGFSPIFLVIAGLVLVVGFVFLRGKIHA